jgi:hypothetical protein
MPSEMVKEKGWNRLANIRYRAGLTVDSTLCGRIIDNRNREGAKSGEDVTCRRCIRRIGPHGETDLLQESLDLEEIALVFCRECLGWKYAHGFTDLSYHSICGSVNKKLADTGMPPYERHFQYTLLDKVMEAVRTWLSALDAYEAEGQYEEIVSLVDYLVGTQDQVDVCRDLMSACVEANRSLTRIRQNA